MLCVRFKLHTNMKILNNILFMEINDDLWDFIADLYIPLIGVIYLISIILGSVASWCSTNSNSYYLTNG